MPIKMICTSCQQMLQAPDSAVGKQAKCPKCGNLMTVPEPVQDAEEVVDPLAPTSAGGPPDAGEGIGDLLHDEDTYRLADEEPLPKDAASDTGGDRRPCPMCGEMIIATAAKCRFCGEVFDPTLRKKARTKSYGRDDEDLTTGDWVLAVLCSGIGCIIGIIWLIQGKPKGGKMIGVSILFSFLWSAIRALIEMAAQ